MGKISIKIISDLHLEFSGWKYKYSGEDCLIIAGDICPKTTNHNNLMFDLFKSINVPTFFVLGNHDYYHSDLEKLPIEINEEIKSEKLKNIHLLHNSFFDFNGYRFCGTPLFSDFNLYNNQILDSEIARKSINDFKLIKYKEKLINSYHYINANFESREFLKKQILESELPLIFITHWAINKSSIDDKYKNDNLNPYFVNNCDELLNDKVKCWIFGHIHNNVNQVVNGVRCICNPRGYPNENPKWEENLIITV